MIAGYEIERAVAERLPQAFAILALANRRRAFEFRGAIGNFGGRKSQIVRAGLRGDCRPAALASRNAASASADETWTM